MHFFIIGSSAVITYLICNTFLDCFKRDYRRDYFDFLCGHFPEDECLNRIDTLQFFSNDVNYDKLKKVLDYENNIYEKTLQLVRDNSQINEDYVQTQNYYGAQQFNSRCLVPVVIEIRDSKFNTSMAQLNYIRWLIVNDYFLHLE